MDVLISKKISEFVRRLFPGWFGRRAGTLSVLNRQARFYGRLTVCRLLCAAVAVGVAPVGRGQAQTFHVTQIAAMPSSAIVAGNKMITVKWTGGSPPFQVQFCAGFDGAWQDVGGITYGSSQTNILIVPSAYYRVASVASVMAASPDKTAPTVPGGLSVTTANSRQVNLRWNTSVDPGTNATGVKGYNVYRNGIFLNQVATPALTDEDGYVTPQSTNSYSVCAVDYAYNQSAPSASVIGATPAAGNCSFLVAPLNVAFDSAGGRSNLTVAASGGCSWTALGGSPWITIDSGNSGTGDGTVSFSVTANTNASPRTGALLIAEQTVTVTQSGAGDVTPPGVSLTTPTNGSTVSNNIVLAATASDNVGVAKVEFYCDGANLIGTATSAPYSVSYDTDVVTNGSHRFTARAYDAAGNSASANSTVVVSNTITPPTGTCLWSRHFGGTTLNADKAFSYSVKEDKNGNVVAAGMFQGTVDFGGGRVTSTNGQEMFLIKYDGSGNYLWSRQVSSSGGGRAMGVTTDSSNNIVVVGTFNGTMDFGSGPLSSAGSSDIFVAKFSSNGSLLWAKRFGGSAMDGCSGVAVDATNNILLTGSYGYYGTAVDFGGGALPLSGGTSAWQNDVYVAKLSPDGNYIWAKGYGGQGDDLAGGLAVDGNGDVAVIGSFQQTVSFGGGSFTSAGNYDVFVAKYSGANGSHLWSCSGGGSSADKGYAIAFDPNGNVVATGYFSGNANIGGSALSSPYNQGLPAIFLAKFTSAGTALWSRGFIPYVSYGQATGNGVAVDGTGNIVLTGCVCGAVGFDGAYPGGGDMDILLAKFSPTGGTIWVKSYGSSGNDSGNAVSVGAENNILATGFFVQSADFGSGTMQSGAQYDGFVVKTAP